MNCLRRFFIVLFKKFVRRKDRQSAFVIKERIDGGGIRVERNLILMDITLKLK